MHYTPPDCVSNGRHNSSVDPLTLTYKKVSHEWWTCQHCSSCTTLLLNVTQTGFDIRLSFWENVFGWASCVGNSVRMKGNRPTNSFIMDFI